MTQKYKVLVAEDNDFVRMQIVKFLGDAGYERARQITWNGVIEKLVID